MDTRDMFARLLKCEAGGEGAEGMRAVATVIMNRVHVAYGEYQRVCQGNLRCVMEQICQFDCLKSALGGMQNPQNIWVATPEDIHYEIADWAINGGISSGAGAESLWYMNPFNPVCPDPFPYNGSGYWYTRIHQHCFFNPTNLYAET